MLGDNVGGRGTPFPLSPLPSPGRRGALVRRLGKQSIPCACPFLCLPFPPQVIHVFSHIHQTYVVYSLPLDGDVTLDPALSPSRWVTEEEFHTSAVSTAMKKVPRGPGSYSPFPPPPCGLRRAPKLCVLSWLQDPAAVQLWALLCFLQVLKACEKQRGKDSDPGKVGIAGGCTAQELPHVAVGPGVWCWSPMGFGVRPWTIPSLG